MIRKARIDELPLILPIYAAARSFMAASGNPGQWVNGYPREDLLREDISRGQLYVQENEGRIGAVFVYREGPEKTYGVIWDGAWLNEEPYGVLHRIAVAVPGHGLGAACLNWCLEQCGNLRVDTHEKNQIMRRLLDRKGFTRCGRIRVEDGSERIAFQKCLAPVREGGSLYEIHSFIGSSSGKAGE